ncbi:Bifunctional ligase/repressor BirA [Aquisphaera giovannonii]|uniref:biotin--[biotin carboxyl-carrier protein] ligase n=1 Tax=Aquisphaera giovannonii TaxID=406548 RepID=A0A5B9W6K0_9BACT|nr:biotin--[acetyl-CoA-carboxylase] ligase [Aquisphaera giovannonii]QEH36233.1 Bifunctional ligase/repressor BirA [Aquisphaera giovannonii]
MRDPLPFARTVLHRPVVDSTNWLARSLVLQGVDELPLLVWADRQTLGRGQRDRSWFSDDGSLTFTVAIDPAAHGLRVDQEPRLSLAAALAVIHAIGSLGWVVPGLGIRWPNDVEACGRKLCGILPERIERDGLEGPSGHLLVIGIGLNVLTRFDEAPDEVSRMATSLAAMGAGPLDASSIPRALAAILTHLDLELRRLRDDSPEQAREWDHLNLLRGKPVRIDLGPRILAGRATDIDPRGALCVDDGSEVHHLSGGRVLRD